MDFQFYTIIGSICGGHWISRDEKCHCGKDVIHFQMNDTFFCCTNATCFKEDNNITCKKGHIKRINEMCNNVCPFVKYSNVVNNLAITTSNCSRNQVCFETMSLYSKICKKPTKETKSSSGFFYKYCSESQGKNCDLASNSKITFHQCYQSYM